MTTTSRPAFFSELLAEVEGDVFWKDYLTRMVNDECLPLSLHLAVMVEPFLQLMLEGKKTIESRFSANRCAPYGRVQPGDVILLKRTGGPIVGLCRVSNRWFYELDPKSRETIKEKFARAMCAESPKFWKEREKASYATLMRVNRVHPINPIRFQKRDRRGWVVLKEYSQQLALEELFMKPAVIGFSGKIGSGKTTVSSSLAKMLNWSRMSFGDYVRATARQRGLAESREVLQRLGESLLATDAEGFCRAALAQADWKSGQPLIIDGVRHTLVVEILRRLVKPMRFMLVHIAVDETLRESRLLALGETNQSSLRQIEKHSTEKDVSLSLQYMADLTVHSSLPVEETLLRICRVI